MNTIAPEVVEALLSRGYREYTGHDKDRLFQRQVDDVPPSESNGGKVFIDVVFYHFEAHHDVVRRVTVRLVADTTDDTWWELSAYSLADAEIPARIDDLGRRLCAAYAAVAVPT